MGGIEREIGLIKTIWIQALPNPVLDNACLQYFSYKITRMRKNLHNETLKTQAIQQIVHLCLIRNYISRIFGVNLRAI